MVIRKSIGFALGIGVIFLIPNLLTRPDYSRPYIVLILGSLVSFGVFLLIRHYDIQSTKLSMSLCYGQMFLVFITQLLNSLMGIAVLPYEMHKEYFNERAVKIESDDYRFKKDVFNDNQCRIRSYHEHNGLKEWILQKHREKKWETTYNSDKIGIDIKEKAVVFNFLRHMRNAVCHSGNNSLSILPLDDGVVIKEVLFYDQNKDNQNEEFAMRLSIDELHELIELVNNFYCYTEIGSLDKTETIKKVEDNVYRLLGRNYLQD